MKKVIFLILTIFLISVFLISCAKTPAEGAEVTPFPSPTTSEEPQKTDELNYDDVVLPEPKSEKWKSYKRIVYSLLAPKYFDPFDEKRKNDIHRDGVGTTIGEDLLCGCYPFDENTNSFYAQKIVTEPDDMYFIDIQIIRDSLRKKIEPAYEEKLAEAEKLNDAQARQYIEGLHDAIENALLNEDFPRDGSEGEKCSIFYYATYDNYLIGDAYVRHFKDVEARYDKKWIAEHGNLDAKAYLNALMYAKEYRHKMSYSLVKEEIDYFNSMGFDLYYYYNLDFEKYLMVYGDYVSTYLDPGTNAQGKYTDPRLRGFIPAKILQNLSDIKLPNGGTVYFAYEGAGFLKDYCGIHFEDLPDYSWDEDGEYWEDIEQMYNRS